MTAAGNDRDAGVVEEITGYLAACRTFPLAGRIAHRSWNLTV